MAQPSEVVVKFKGDKSDLSKTIDDIGSETSGMADRMESTGRGLTMGLTLPIIGAGVAAVSAANEQEVADAKLAATIESMGAASWTSVEALKEQASALQENSTFGDEAIQGFQDLMLTFGNVKNEFGEGNDIFDQTTQIGIDMSAALGQDLKSSAIQLGKALNDPVAGISALSRVGVSFTEDQKEMIEALVESGDTMGAQKIILDTLEQQFGGTAEAMANTTQGQMKQAMNDLGDAAESIGAILGPIIGQMADFLADLSRRFQQLSPGARRIIVLFGGLAAAAGPLLIVGGKMVRGFRDVSRAFGALKAVFAANPYLVLIAATVAIVTLIITNWDSIKEFLVETWEKIKEIAAKVWEGIRDGIAAVLGFIKDAFLNWTGPGLIIKHWDDIKDAAKKVWEWVRDQFNKLIRFLTDLPGNIAGMVGNLASRVWDPIKNAATTVWEWVRDKFQALIDFVTGVPGALVQMTLDLASMIWNPIKAGATTVWEWVRDKFDDLVSFFTGLPERIKDALLGLWDTIKAPFVEAWNAMVALYNNTVGRIPGFGQIGGGGGRTGPGDLGVPKPGDGPGMVPLAAAAATTKVMQPVQLVVDSRVLAETMINYERGLA
jgi:phage-related minor tail protein